MSVSQLLVPNNFALYAESISTGGIGAPWVYQTASINANAMGPWASPIPVTINLVKNGVAVLMTISVMVATLGTTATTISFSATVPTAFLKPGSTDFYATQVQITNGSATATGIANVSMATGVILIAPQYVSGSSIEPGNFETGGQVGCTGVSIGWIV